MNQEKKNAWQRNHRKLNGNSCTKKYEKTKKGFLMRLYRNMQSRINGVQKVKSHLYEGKSLLSRDEFYSWTESNKQFYDLFEAWENSNYERRLTPSVDRIDSSLGYELHNMEWIPFHENCRRGALSKFRLNYGK